MVKAVAEPERLTPAADAPVTFWATMTPRDWRVDIHDAAGVVLVNAESFQLLFGGSEVGFGVLLRVFGLLQHGLRDCAVLEQIVGPHVSHVGHVLVVGRLEIGVEGAGDVRALHLQQQLALLHVVVEAGLDVHHAAVGDRDDRNLARDVGKDGAGSRQLRRRFDLPRCERELGRIVGVDGDQVHVGNLNHFGRRRRAVALILALAATEYDCKADRDG